MPFSFNVMESGVVATIINGRTVFERIFENGALPRQVDYDISAGDWSTNTIGLRGNCGAFQTVL